MRSITFKSELTENQASHCSTLLNHFLSRGDIATVEPYDDMYAVIITTNERIPYLLDFIDDLAGKLITGVLPLLDHYQLEQNNIVIKEKN